MSCCGGSCGCGPSCSCGSGSKGCSMHPDLGFSENTATKTVIAGVAPPKMLYEKSDVMFGAETGCKCGSSCSCDPCTCK